MTNHAEKNIEFEDLRWLSGVEQAALLAAQESKLLALFDQGLHIDPLHHATGVPVRILEVLRPVLLTADRKLLYQPPQRLETVTRMKALLAGGESFLKGSAETFSSMWSKGTIDLPSARSFSKQMFHKTNPPAALHCARHPFKEMKYLVDVGGGGGAWAAQAITHHAELSVTVYDLENVNQATREILAAEMPTAMLRLHLVNGNFFNDPLPQAEAYLLSQILHDWPPATCVELLTRIRKQMPEKSKLFIHECLLDDLRQGPKFTCLFNLLMLMNHASQQFTFQELAEILMRSGFRKPRVVSNVAHYALLEVQA